MQHTTGLGHAHLTKHVVRIHMRGALPIRVLVPQVQLHRHVTAHGKLELARHAVNLHVMRCRRDIVIIVHVVVQADFANTGA